MTDQSPQIQIETINKAFDQEFERFAPFAGAVSALAALNLEQALAEQRAVSDLRARYLGKKSALAATKKLIGRVAPEERASFGKQVQTVEDRLTTMVEQVELRLG